MAAYEYVLTGKFLHHRSTRESNSEALRVLERAIQLDPEYAHAHTWKACVVGQAWLSGWNTDTDACRETVEEELQVALSLDDNDADVHRVFAAVNLTFNELDKAHFHQEKALRLNPNCDVVAVQHGELLTWLGRPQEGIEWILRAMRLNPYHPERFWSHLGRAQFSCQMYPESVKSFSRITAPDHSHHASLAGAFAKIGNKTAATAHADEVLKLNPAFSIERYMASLHYKKTEDRLHHRQALLEAGLPK